MRTKSRKLGLFVDFLSSYSLPPVSWRPHPIEGVIDPAMVVPVGAEGCLTEFDVGKSITWILDDKKLGF